VFIAGGLAAARESGAGIAQRVLIVMLATWFLLTAARLRSIATRCGGNYEMRDEDLIPQTKAPPVGGAFRLQSY